MSNTLCRVLHLVMISPLLWSFTYFTAIAGRSFAGCRVAVVNPLYFSRTTRMKMRPTPSCAWTIEACLVLYSNSWVLLRRPSMPLPVVHHGRYLFHPSSSGEFSGSEHRRSPFYLAHYRNIVWDGRAIHQILGAREIDGLS